MNNQQNLNIDIPKIRVIVRKRPLNKKEQEKNELDIIEIKDKKYLIVKEIKTTLDLSKIIEPHNFIFDIVYDENSTNENIYLETVRPMIQCSFYNKSKITCFAYGQTGSGKTYTMMGNNFIENDTGPKVPGLYLLSAIDMFNYLSMDEYNNLTFYVSFYEIYCNKLFDLLNNKNLLQAREDGKGNIHIAGLIEKEINNLNELKYKYIYNSGADLSLLNGYLRQFIANKFNVSNEDDIRFRREVIADFIDRYGEEAFNSVIKDNPDFKDPEKMAHKYCDVANVTLFNNPGAYLILYQYVLGNHFAVESVKRCDEDMLKYVKNITLNLQDADINGLFDKFKPINKNKKKKRDN